MGIKISMSMSMKNRLRLYKFNSFCLRTLFLTAVLAAGFNVYHGIKESFTIGIVIWSAIAALSFYAERGLDKKTDNLKATVKEMEEMVA